MASPSPNPAHATLKSHFSQSQMAVALAIARSLPESLSMKEYCTELQKSLKPTSIETQIQNSRHIDSCEFWQGLYERSHQEIKELRVKLQVSEERLRITERPSSPKLGGLDRSKVSAKRPAGLEEVEDWINEERPDPILFVSDDYLRLSSCILRIGRKRRDLKEIINDSNIPEHIDTLSMSACELLRLAETSLSDCLMPLWALKCNDDSQIILLLQQMMHQTKLGFLTSFEALEELANTIAGRKKRFEVTNRLLTFFGKALDCLHHVSGLQALDEMTKKERPRNKRAKMQEGEYAINKYLSRTLVQICEMEWKPGQLSHSEILEGILCTVLSHSGKLLSQVVFKEHVASSDKQGNICTGKPSQPFAATKFEFRYIIPILHTALGGATRRDLVTRVLADSRRTSRATDLPDSLLSKMKRLIQETLVKNTVGADVEGLKMPPTPEDTDTYAPEVCYRAEPYESEWFLESVWALVGWELTV